MITLHPQSLTPEIKSRLQQWLKSEEAAAFKTAIATKIALAEVQVLDNFVESNEDNDLLKTAREAADVSLFYQRVLGLLQEVEAGTFELQSVMATVEINPRTTTKL